MGRWAKDQPVRTSSVGHARRRFTKPAAVLREPQAAKRAHAFKLNRRGRMRFIAVAVMALVGLGAGWIAGRGLIGPPEITQSQETMQSQTALPAESVSPGALPSDRPVANQNPQATEKDKPVPTYSNEASAAPPPSQPYAASGKAGYTRALVPYRPARQRSSVRYVTKPVKIVFKPIKVLNPMKLKKLKPW
jgi:hypothetical protein